MFKIIKENKVLGIVSNPTWVRMQDNGCYGLTIEDNAQGIALMVRCITSMASLI